MNKEISEKQITNLVNLYSSHKFNDLDKELDNMLQEYSHPLLHNLRGGMFISLGDYQKAEKEYKHLIKIFPDYYDGFINLAIVYQKTNRIDEALKIYEEILEYDKINNESKINIFHNTGTLFLEKGEYDKAIVNFSKVLKESPNSFETIKNLGSALRGLKRYEESIEEYKKCLSIIKETDEFKAFYPEISMEITQNYRSLGNYSKANIYLEKGPGIIKVLDKYTNDINNKKFDIKGPINENFIGCWSLDNHSLMDNIVNFFENNKQKQGPGRAEGIVNLDHKSSIDVTILPSDLEKNGYNIFKDYSDILCGLYNDYKASFKILPKMNVYLSNLNIQKYNTGGHYQGFHTERTGKESMHRMFAWMTYLNDVDDGGETYFPHYDLRFKPEKGKTLIWPSDWTHAHCGEIVKSGEKYIINGWFELIQS